MGRSTDVSSSYSFAAVTPSDSTNLPAGCRGLYVGVGGNIVVIAPNDTSATFLSVPAGTVLPVQAKRVNSTSTTATNLIALF
jgi:hypothetical protein